MWDFYIYSEMLNTYALEPGNANLNLNLGSLFFSILQTLVDFANLFPRKLFIIVGFGVSEGVISQIEMLLLQRAAFAVHAAAVFRASPRSHGPDRSKQRSMSALGFKLSWLWMSLDKVRNSHYGLQSLTHCKALTRLVD